MNQQKILYKAIVSVLKPLVKILLRNNMPYGVFADLARRAYVEVATKEFAVAGRKQSNSRIATITGLSRKEVKRIQEIDEEQEENLVDKYNRAARVVYGWVHDENYQQKPGEALVLSFDGEMPSFSALVKAYSGDVPPRAILDELERVGVVTIDENGQIRLLFRVYIPKTAINEKLEYLGSDVSALIQTMDRNIHDVDKPPFFQRKVYYDNLPEESIAALQQLITKNSQALLEKIDQAMAAQDRDVHPEITGSGRKAIGVSIYYFENDDIEEKTDD